MGSQKKEQTRMSEILKALKRTYPAAECALHYKTPFQLLCATILSAQCTDERVNLVTPVLFRKFPDAKTMARATQSEVETIIHSTGFFKNKARALIECSQAIVEKYQSEVPRTLEELTALRGVGRKTANVVLGNAFDVPGLVVDTHVGRLSRRLGFTKKTDPEKVEAELMILVPHHDWTLFSHLLIHHGRNRCRARNPDCKNCELQKLCPRQGVLN